MVFCGSCDSGLKVFDFLILGDIRFYIFEFVVIVEFDLLVSFE